MGDQWSGDYSTSTNRLNAFSDQEYCALCAKKAQRPERLQTTAESETTTRRSSSAAEDTSEKRILDASTASHQPSLAHSQETIPPACSRVRGLASGAYTRLTGLKPNKCLLGLSQGRAISSESHLHYGYEEFLHWQRTGLSIASWGSQRQSS